MTSIRECIGSKMSAVILGGAAIALTGLPASAALLYVNVPTINGLSAVPGYPGAMVVQSLTIAPDNFSVVKTIDSASPQISAAISTGGALGTATALFYNAAATAPPDFTFTFDHTLASSQVLGISNETDGFSATTPASIYIQLLGITGGASTPGYTGLISADSLTITDNTFSVTKPVDGTSSSILNAVANSVAFPGATVLFYNGAPSGPPDAVLNFHLVLANSQQSVGGTPAPMEQDTFTFAAVPEPGTMLLTIVAPWLVARGRERRTE